MTEAHASTTKSSKYLEFLVALYQAKNARGDLILLESTDQRFLEFITVQWVLKKPLSMMQILMSREVLFLGASTISRKVDALREAGWIHTIADQSDRRIKWLAPTDQALAYLERVNTLMPE